MGTTQNMPLVAMKKHDVIDKLFVTCTTMGKQIKIPMMIESSWAHFSMSLDDSTFLLDTLGTS